MVYNLVRSIAIFVCVLIRYYSHPDTEFKILEGSELECSELEGWELEDWELEGWELEGWELEGWGLEGWELEGVRGTKHCERYPLQQEH